ncbi:MAG: sigma 54-interacting transcriptional regulator [Planctomycetes bacterium]|nr:sigma 54-interacting transcriptional regulator [Planctomycetota bacterium]
MAMNLLSSDERRFARAIAALSRANPFLPERIDAERDALGADFVATEAVWSHHAVELPEPPNLEKLGSRAASIAESARKRLGRGAGTPGAEDARLYEDLVLYALYHRVREPLFSLLQSPKPGRGRVACWEDFNREARRLLDVEALPLSLPLDPAHWFAVAWQVRRAFHHVFTLIVGGSLPAARLRAAVWQSVFTHDLPRYRRSLWSTLGELTTLVVGPSGTGKELAARAIALSRYIPFDPRSASFAAGSSESFFPLNIAALPATLVESELFGHRRGAFTGAVADRAGWLEACPPHGTVFLDEIGDLDGALQVKLLRVLQSREFQRLGDTAPRRFQGKLVAATNRDLARDMRAGRFRPDLYYRLCSDVVRTPTLREQLSGSPAELHNFLRLIARRLAGPDEEAVAAEAEAWIRANLPADYAWPGNVRELEQCVANILVRHAYEPAAAAPVGAMEELSNGVEAGAFTVEELLKRYCSLVYAKTDNFEEAARRLEVDRRTVKAHVDPALVTRYQVGPGSSP